MQGLTHLLVSSVKGAKGMPTMGKYEECKITLASLLEDEDESGLELTLGLSLGGSKSKGTGKSGLNQRSLKEAEEQKSTSSADYILKLSSKEQGFSNIRETDASAPVQLPWITLNKGVVPGHEHDGLVHPSVVSGFLERSSHEEVADREDPRLYAQQLFKILQDKAVRSELPGGLERTDQITVHAAAAAAMAAWAQSAPMGFPMPVFEKHESFKPSAAAWVPGISATSAGGDSSIILPNGVKPPAKLATYSSLGAVDMVINEKHEVNRTASLDRNQWQTMTQQQEMVEQQRKQELHARQEARKKRRNLIDEQKQQKKLARSEDEKANSNSAKVSLQIPGSLAPKSSLQVARDLLSSQAGGEPGAGLSSNTSPSSKVSSGGWTVPPKKLERKQTSGSTDLLNEDNEQLREIRRALVRERDKAAKEREMEAENRLITGQTGRRSSAEMALLHRMKGEQAATPLKTPVEAGVGPSIGETEDGKSSSEVWMKQFFDTQKMMIDPQAYAVAVATFKNKTEDVRNGTQVRDSIIGRIRDPAEGQMISGISTFNNRAADCEENKSNCDARGTEKVNMSSAHEECQFVTLGAATASTELGLASLPLPHPSFLHMQMPFPTNVPIGNNFGMPCPMPLPYPYFLQCLAPPPGVTPNSSPSSLGNTPFQMAIPGYSRFQPPAMETQAQGISKLYSPVQSSHSLSAPSAQKKSVTSTADHESKTQGMKVGQDVEVCRPISTREPPKGCISALLRAASLNSAQGQMGPLARAHLPFAVPQSGSATPLTPAVGLMRTLSEPGEKCLRRQGSESSPFASLVAAVEASQGLSAAVASVSKCSSQTGRRGLECSSSKGSFDAQDKASARSTQSRGSCELSCSDSMHKSRGFDEAVEKKNVEQSKKGTLQDLEVAAVLAQEGTTVRPGIAAGQTFGGTGSSPDLPWVSTTGTGPNGKTISGVLYRYVKGEVKILCACHGKHMTPREFVQHAGGVDVPNPEKRIVVNPFPFVGEAASVIG